MKLINIDTNEEMPFFEKVGSSRHFNKIKCLYLSFIALRNSSAVILAYCME